MQGLLHSYKMPSDTQSYLSIASNITGHFRQASPKKESGATDDNCGGEDIISLFLGRLVYDSSERFFMK